MNPEVNAELQSFHHEKRSVATSAIVMSMGTMTSRVLGLVRDSLTAAVFDRTVTDAWLVAFRLPNFFRRMLGEGSLSISFIPVFIDLLKPGRALQDNTAAQKLVNGVFTLLFGFLTVLTTLGVIFSEQILGYLVSGEGFMSVPGKFELTVHMAKIMFGFIALVSVYAYFMALLNSFKRFAMAAFAPTLFNVAMIASALFPDSTAWPGEALAWGVIVGGFLQMICLVPSLIREGCLPRFTWDIWNDSVKRVIWTLLPSWVGVGILQLTSLVNVHFAAELGEGTHSWIYFADRVLELPLSLVAVSLGSALLPTLSRLWSMEQKDRMVETSTHYLKLTFSLSIPAAVGMYVLARPIVEVLFRHGHFDETDTFMTTAILQVYALSILAYGGVRVIVSPFYAIKNTWLPACFAAVSLATHYIVASHLVHTMGATGLAFSTAISSFVNLILLFVAHNKIIGRIHLWDFTLSMARYVVAAAAMAMVLILYFPLNQYLESLPGHQIFCLFLTIFFGIIIYIFSAHAFGATELSEVMDTIFKKIGSRLKANG